MDMWWMILKFVAVLALMLLAAWLVRRAKKLGYFERKEFASYKGTKFWIEPDKVFWAKYKWKIGIPFAVCMFGFALHWIVK
jgi:hypothetical protein